MRTILTALLISLLTLQACEKSTDNNVNNVGANGTGANGSLTRFITYNNYLYIVDLNFLKTYDISNPATPVFKTINSIGFNIETIFEYNGNLFIGSNDAIFIYGLSNPEQPNRLSQFNYFIPGRDPVVAIDSVAYSTTRNLFGMGGNLNIVNIKNINAPRGMGSLQMPSPYGLAINRNALYVCNGNNGITILNRTLPYEPTIVGTYNPGNEIYYDLIVRGNIMVCYIQSGIVLLDVSNPLQPTFISSIKN